MSTQRKQVRHLLALRAHLVISVQSAEDGREYDFDSDPDDHRNCEGRGCGQKTSHELRHDGLLLPEQLF
jgi:hypothetical protein